jgi:hypothetical protein
MKALGWVGLGGEGLIASAYVRNLRKFCFLLVLLRQIEQKLTFYPARSRPSTKQTLLPLSRVLRPRLRPPSTHHSSHSPHRALQPNQDLRLSLPLIFLLRTNPSQPLFLF